MQVLIERFEEHASRYYESNYQEAEARKDFVDPLLKALGWDVDHETQHNPYEQEVKVERGIAHSQKRADYAFYLAPNYRDVRFYVEAKRPSVDLRKSVDSHFQTLRYGYSAGTPLALLTSFSEVCVLDCRGQPHPDTALDHIYKYWSIFDFKDKDRFAEFYWLFSREAHVDGSYQRRLSELPTPTGGVKQRGLFRGGFQPVDATFLAEIDGFRGTLARAFKAADNSLDTFVLTSIVQRTLDRLVFMRFLEDKQIETEITVSDFGKGAKGAWADFRAASRRLDGIYNGIVFKELDHLDGANVVLSETVFKDVCERLAAENSPYNFDAIPIHILGSIYERFLGSVISTGSTTVWIEQKPEVAKAGGVYYTPEVIVRYIVGETVSKLIAGKSPTEISKLRFIDVSCGSGSFLLGVYDALLRYHAEWYNRPENSARAKRDKCVQTDDGHWRLSLAQRRQILINNVFGVDIDSQAVEVAQLSLFLKLLEEERATTARQYQLDYARDSALKRLLPDLSSNVICGNSLVEWDVVGFEGMTPAVETRLNPLNLKDAFPEVMKAGGFDAVVGNPPYVDSEWMTVHWPLLRTYCTNRYAAASGNWDMFCVFVERAAQICKKGGYASLILPNKLGSAAYATGARRVIARHSLLSIRDYSHVPVFPVSVYPIVYVTQNRPQSASGEVLYERVSQGSHGEFAVASGADLSYSTYFSPPESPWRIFSNTDAANPSTRIKQENPSLGSIATVSGAATVSEAYEIAPLIADGASGLRLVNSGTIDKYQFLWGLKHFRYLKSAYLKPTISGENLKELPEKRLTQAHTPKIIVAGMTKELECGLDARGTYLAGKSTTVIFWGGDLRYLIGLLNSRLIDFFYNTMFGGDKLSGGYLRIGPPQLKQIPIKIVAKDDHANLHRAREIATLVDQIVETAPSRWGTAEQAKEVARRKCAALQGRIDALVYELYGLTSAEIESVESAPNG
jgi:hypothetical protein